MTTEREYGRVSALKIEKYNIEKDEIEIIWKPQFEIIEYDGASGLTNREFFASVQGVECESEPEALKYAMNFRDNLE